MRLSDAIRLGAMMRPQAFRTLLTDHGACALGAALLAVGARRIGSAFGQWPWAFAVSVNCPNCGRSRRVCEVITHLNDDHRWTREEIGAWVAGIEPPGAGLDRSSPTRERIRQLEAAALSRLARGRRANSRDRVNDA